MADSSNTDASSDSEVYDSFYSPIVAELVNDKGPSITIVALNIEMSQNIDYPKISYGFHHYIHANKNKMEVVKQFENKKKVYQVKNQFEKHIDNYDEDISNSCEKYFNTKQDRPAILGNGFYKLWEMLCMFDLVSLTESNFVSAHLSEGSASFIQATMYFRDMYSTSSKKDKYYCVTLHPEDGNLHAPELEKKFVNNYEKESPQRLVFHKTYSKKMVGGNASLNDGDLTNPKTINLFGGQLASVGEKADFITADGGIEWEDGGDEWENNIVQEQESFRLIFAKIYAAFTIQKKGGNFVLKFYETFSDTSVKLMYILTQLYENVYATKPLTSRSSNSEKYLVCKGFKYSQSDANYGKMHKILSTILETLHGSPKKNMIKIFDNFAYPTEFLKTIKNINQTIANEQLKTMGSMLRFIEAQNYYGDDYKTSREEQIKAANYWTSTFLVKPNNIKQKLEDLRKSTNSLIKQNTHIVKNLTYN
jgi:23S rRNA U2552 (ribose-2'-O)-methylase RlmE/FtsJ